MGAAAAASKLMGLNAWQTRMALGIAGSQASGLRRNFGTMTKPFHPGHAARSGIVAAKLASRGYTADPDIIEGRQGYADNFGGPKCNIPAITKFLGQLWYLAAEGTRVKPWPCCGGNHQPLTNLFGLMAREPIAADDVEWVEHSGPAIPCTGALLRDEVHEGLEGKFCLRYNLAAAIIDRKVDHDTFTDARAGRGDLQAFMERVRLVRNSDVAMRRSHIADGNPEAKLTIQMKDGRLHEVVFGPAMHLSQDATVDKFQMNAGLVFDADSMGKTIDAVGRLETLPEAGAVLDAVTRRA
jgi:2-methylcitrate dehydratase PrpD